MAENWSDVVHKMNSASSYSWPLSKRRERDTHINHQYRELSRGPKGCEHVGEEKISSYWLQLESIGIMDIKSVGNIPMHTVRSDFGAGAGVEEGLSANQYS